MASEAKKKVTDKKIVRSKSKEKILTNDNIEARPQTEEERENNVPRPPPSNIIDGRVFEADRELALSEEEEEEVRQFKEDLRKYHKIAKQMREETLKREKKQLMESEKSPRLKYYTGTKTDRINDLDLEIEILEQIEKLAASKQK